MDPYYYQKRLLKDFTNLSLLFRRNYDGHIVSMHQAGTHWLRNLIANVIVREYALPAPEHIRSDSVVGGQNKIPVHHGPKIVQSHKIPGPLFSLPVWRKILEFPKYVVLIRDPRVSIASHYKKHRNGSPKSFSEFLRNKGKDGYFLKDIWDDVRFLNTWIPIAESWPSNVLVVRYEDLRKDTPGKLREIVNFFDIQLTQDDTLDWSIQQCSKENMSNREAPDNTTKVVRPDEANPLSIYSADDRAYFLDIYRRHLKAAIPYDLSQW
jgi:hypothetical protein